LFATNDFTKKIALKMNTLLPSYYKQNNQILNKKKIIKDEK